MGWVLVILAVSPGAALYLAYGRIPDPAEPGPDSTLSKPVPPGRTRWTGCMDRSPGTPGERDHPDRPRQAIRADDGACRRHAHGPGRQHLRVSGRTAPGRPRRFES